MTASTVVSNSANSDLTVRHLKSQARQRSLAGYKPFGLFMVDSGTIAVATTSVDEVNDRIRLLRMPANAWMFAYRVDISDMDTHATPTLKIKLESDDEAASPTRVLLTSDIDITAGSTEAKFLAGPLSLSSLTVNSIVTAAAATAAAGTIRVRLWCYIDDPQSSTALA